MSYFLPPHVSEFVIQHIDAVEELEILLLLANEPERIWTVADVDNAIRSSRGAVEARLRALGSKGMLSVESDAPPTFRFAPQSEALAKNVRDTAAAYKDYRLRVVEVIFSKPPSPIRIFSDAFKFQKKEKE